MNKATMNNTTVPNANFTFHVPTRIYFGDNQLPNLGSELKNQGSRCIIIYGSPRITRTSLYANIKKVAADASVTLFEGGGVEPNPRHTTVNRMAALCGKENIDVILAVGGGSVIDCAKFVSAATFYEGDAWDFFAGKAQMEHFLPVITIPTLAGTGSDMDAFGIVTNEDTAEKIPLYHPSLFPVASFLDPTLTYTVSPYQTACGAIDAFTHYLEVYFMRPNMGVHILVMEAFMKAILRAIPRVLADPNDYAARADIMWASSWALNGFTFGPTGGVPFTCHWIEDELSAKYDITHGLGLAILLPRYMEYCLNEQTAPIFRDLAVNVLDVDPALPAMTAARKGIEALEKLFFKTCGLKRRLRDCGIMDDSRFAEMARVACRNSVIHGLVDLTVDDVVSIYRKSW